MFGNCNICGKKSSKDHPDLCEECLEISKPIHEWLGGGGKKHDGARDILKEVMEAQAKLSERAWGKKGTVNEPEKGGPKTPVKKRLN